MEFVIGAALLVVLVLGILAFPWWHQRKRGAPPPLSGGDLAAELGDDVAAGLLAAEDLEPAARDLEVGAEADSERPESARRRWSWGAAALLLVPLAAGVLYVHFGSWRAALFGEKAAVVHRMESSLAELRAHLGKHPGDVQGWLDLGQGEEVLGRYRDAAQALGRAVALQKPPNADTLGLWGEAQLLADPRQVTPEEQRIFMRVLKLDPNNARGLWYGGLIALSAGNRAQALKDWRRLLARPDVPAQVADIVRSHLAVLGATATAAKAATTTAANLRVTVGVAPALASKVKAGEALYVFVRNPDGGPPYAVRRIKAGDFPVTVTLDDADAMLAGRNLSSMEGKTVEVGAFLSASGDAAPRAGDLSGSKRLELQSGAQTVSLEIDRVAGETQGTPDSGGKHS